jgi:TRAP-type C4-dicarboxylate transport system substrate-binding protein
MTHGLTRRKLALALGAAAVLPASRAHAVEFVLRFASINLANTAAYQQILVPFAQAVEKDSAGRIEVALKPMGGYGKPADLFNMTERGDIDIAATVQGYNAGRFPRSSVMELPLMFDSAVAGTHALWKLFQDGDVAADYASVKVLGLYMLPPYGIFINGKKIAQLKDLRGLRVRTPSPTVGLALSRLGAIPVGVPSDMIGDMLESRTIDAITYGWDSLTTGKGSGDKKLADQVDVLVDANFAAPALMVVMNRAKWDGLPPDLQAIIDKHSANLVTGNAKLRDEAEAVARAKLRVDPHYTYRELTADERAEMARTIQPAVADWKAAMAHQAIDGEALYEKARTLARQFHTAAR